MAVATKPKKAKKVAPPVPEARKALPINAAYDDKARDLVRDAIKKNKVSISELHERLTAMGVQISEGGMANKISRGGFSSAFLMQCMEALGVDLEKALSD